MAAEVTKCDAFRLAKCYAASSWLVAAINGRIENRNIDGNGLLSDYKVWA